MPAEDTAATPYEGWSLVELMGHRRLAGRVSEVQIAGVGFLRVDVPKSPDLGDPELKLSQLYSPQAVYAITPVSEEVARRIAARHSPEPVYRWELPQIEASSSPEVGDDEFHDQDEAEGEIPY